MVRDYKITIVLTDTNLQSNSYTYNLRIYNEPPYFERGKPKNLIMKINDQVFYPFAKFKDDEFNPVNV